MHYVWPFRGSCIVPLVSVVFPWRINVHRLGRVSFVGSIQRIGDVELLIREVTSVEAIAYDNGLFSSSHVSPVVARVVVFQ